MRTYKVDYKLNDQERGRAMVQARTRNKAINMALASLRSEQQPITEIKAEVVKNENQSFA